MNVLPESYDDQRRSASASIRGYLTQFIYTAIMWVELDEDTKLVAEGLEDVDKIIAEDGVYRTVSQEQVKDLSTNVTIRTQDVRKSVANFLTDFRKRKEVAGQFLFATTAKLGKNNLDDVLTCDVLSLWKGIDSIQQKNIGKIFTNLERLYKVVPEKESDNEKEKRETVCNDLRWLKKQKLESKFIQAVHWKFNIPGVDEHKQQLVESIAKIFPDQVNSKQFSDRVLHAVIFASSKSVVDERILDFKLLRDLATGFSEEYEIWAKRVGLERISTYQRDVWDNDVIQRFQYVLDRSKFRSFKYEEAQTFSEKLETNYSGIRDATKAEIYEKLGAIAASDNKPEHAKRFRDLSEGFDPTRDLSFLDLIIYTQKNPTGIDLLIELDTPRSKSAALAFIDKYDLWQKYKHQDWTDVSSKGNLLLVFRKQCEFKKLRETLDGIVQDELDNAYILHLAALAHLCLSVPEIYAGNLSVPPANIKEIEFLRSELKRVDIAKDLFEKSFIKFDELDLKQEKSWAEDCVLWLCLAHSDVKGGCERLSSDLRSVDVETSLKRVWWAVQSEIKIDKQAIERKILESVEHCSENASSSASFALIYLAFEDPQEALRILRTLGKLLRFETRVELTVQSLVRYHDEEKASRYLDKHKSKLADVLFEEWSVLITGTADDECERLILLFEKNEDIYTLRKLVQKLGNTNRWEENSKYGRKLFGQTKLDSDFEYLLKAHHHLQEASEVRELMDANTEYTSSFIKKMRFWSDFFLGDFDLCYKLLEHDEDFAQTTYAEGFQIDLAIQSGRWENFPGEVERILKNGGDSREIFGAAEIAQIEAPLRVTPLLREAMVHSDNDPRIAAKAWLMASQGEKQELPETGEWIQTVIRSASEDSSLQVKPVSGLLSEFELMASDWNAKVQKTRSYSRLGKIPIYVAAESLNQTLVRDFYLRSQLNAKEKDVAKKLPIFAFSGVQRSSLSSEKIQLEATSLLTLFYLGILEQVLESYDVKEPAHCGMRNFDEYLKIGRRQKSTIHQASLLTQALGHGKISVLPIREGLPTRLVTEVGADFASLLVHAKENDGLVVRSSPIVTIETFWKNPEVEADLSNFFGNIISIQHLTAFLLDEHLIPQKDTVEIRARLEKLQDGCWTNSPQVTPDSHLYFDSFSLMQIHEVGIFEILTSLEISVFVSKDAVEQAKNLEDLEQEREGVLADIQKLRKILNLANRVSIRKKHIHEKLKNHPTMDALLQDGPLVSDDRFVNKCRIKNGMFTTLELLKSLQKRNLISKEDRFSYLLALRKSMFVLIPMEQEELRSIVEGIQVEDGQMTETSRAKSFREYYQRLRIEYCLTKDERIWFEKLCSNIAISIKAQWENLALDIDIVTARSDWLLELGNPSFWTDASLENLAEKEYQYLLRVSFFETFHQLNVRRKSESYNEWVESAFLTFRKISLLKRFTISKFYYSSRNT